jgi:hypothetical protein
MAHRVPSSEDASSTNVTFCPLSIFPMSRSVPSSSGRDANDYASGSRNTNFKPLVLGEIQAVGDRPWPFNQNTTMKPVRNTGVNTVKSKDHSGGGMTATHSSRGQKVEPVKHRVNIGAVSHLGAHANPHKQPEILARGAASPAPKACVVHKSGGQGRH